MEEKPRAEIKNYFETGDTPTSGDFASLIDSSINKLDDGIFVHNQKVGLGTKDPKNKLEVAGSLTVGSTYVGKEEIGENNLSIEGNLGVGTTNPKNKLDLSGSGVIGATYAGNVEAPKNGLTIEGNLAIGTSLDNEKLTVDGALSLGEQEGSPSVSDGFGKLFVKKEIVSSVLFNGEDNYLELNHDLDRLNSLKTGTISLWYRPSDEEARIQQLIWRGPELNFQMGIGPWTSGYEDECLMVGISKEGGPELSFYVQRGHDFFTENRWYHIALVVGTNFNKLFIDGIEQELTYTSGRPDTGNIFFDQNTDSVDPLVIGKRNHEGNAQNFISGYLDEIAILDQPLSGWYIKELFEKERKFDLRIDHETSLVAYWRMGESRGLPEVSDFSRNNLNATLKGTIVNEESSEDISNNTLQVRNVSSLYFKDSSGNEVPLSGSFAEKSTQSLWGRKGNDIYYENGSVYINKRLSTQKNQVQRDFVTWYTTSLSNEPVHIKTNMRIRTHIMYRILVEGYNYGDSHSINSEVVGYTHNHYSGANYGTVASEIANNPIIRTNSYNHTPGVSISQYVSSDGYVVIKLKASSSAHSIYYMGFSASAWFTNPTPGNGFEIEALAIRHASGNY